MAYVLDRLISSALSQAPSLADDAVRAEPPSTGNLTPDELLDLGDHRFAQCMIGLAKMSSSIVTSLYGHCNHVTLFSARVQTAVRDLHQWAGGLPPDVRTYNATTAKQPALNHLLHLHLTFNQVSVGQLDACPL